MGVSLKAQPLLFLKLLIRYQVSRYPISETNSSQSQPRNHDVTLKSQRCGHLEFAFLSYLRRAIQCPNKSNTFHRWATHLLGIKWPLPSCSPRHERHPQPNLSNAIFFEWNLASYFTRITLRA